MARRQYIFDSTHEAEGHLLHSEMSFTLFPFWVRVNNLPLAKCNEHTAKAIGTFMEYDNDDPLALSSGLRIRVLLGIGKSLRIGVKLAITQ